MSSKNIELLKSFCQRPDMSEAVASSESGLTEIESATIAYFCDGVRVLGLPPSVGEIYGLLFISQKPLSQADFVERLGISKGSASQGLSLLKALGALNEAKGPDSRRNYFEANLNLKRLVGGFIRNQVRPHLRSGEAKLDGLQSIAELEEDPEQRAFVQERLGKLERWSQRGQMVLPILQRFLGE
ncbi:MarR family transcriptional regulator [Roseibacillus persicicus]|uniref:GbsR/MarR family transcriptional regulator n=1 Tax=Roseibacillus persicicus TaxID=454148 RepID=UPI00398B3C37